MNVELGVYYWQEKENSPKELCLVCVYNGEKIARFFNASKMKSPFFGIFTKVEIVEKSKVEL